MSGWIGVDLDGTLARYDGWVDGLHIGDGAASSRLAKKRYRGTHLHGTRRASRQGEAFYHRDRGAYPGLDRAALRGETAGD